MLADMSPGGGVARRRFFHPIPAAVVVVLLCLGPAPAFSAVAQEPSAALELVRQPAWHSPGDRLGTVLKVTNTGDDQLEGYGVRLRTYAAVEGRIELHESFDGVEEFEIDARIGPFIPTLAPGESTEIIMDDNLTNLGLSVDGVYPIAFSLVDEDLTTELGSVTTQIVFYASRPKDPLNLVPVIPLSDIALKGPGGEFTTTEDGEPLIAEALDPGSGWLSGVLAALDQATAGPSPEEPGFRGGLAPSPRLLEELSDAADGFTAGEDPAAVRDAARGAVDNITSLLTSGELQPLLSPYASVDLPSLTSRFDQETLNRQLSEATVVLDDSLPGVAFDPGWFYAPGLRWDDGSLGDIRIAGSENADHTFFTRHSISGSEDAGCPDVNRFGFAFACPVEIVSEGSPVTGFVADPGLQERLIALAREGEDRVDLQRLFAETAMIHLEQPGTTKRVVQLSIPSQLHPSPYISGRIFSGLAHAPWLTLLPPAQGLDAGPPAERRDLTAKAPTLDSQPEDDFFVAIASAGEALSRYEEIDPPTSRVRRLHRNILEAQSRVWWTPENEATGAEFATLTEQQVDDELANITVEGLDTTLTSQAAPVELTVFNDNSYPVTVDLDLTSEGGDITIQQQDLDELQDLTIGPESNEQITVDARAQSSGIFRLSAVIETPRNGFAINEETITIRSTNFNRIALTLTLGALAFLVLFYIWRWFRRHSGGAPSSEQASS
jgi:hypothetical protein